MSDKKPESAKPEDGTKAVAKAEGGHGESGGIKSWLPLILSLVLMPVLAFATTKFLIIPKVVQAREANHGEEQETPGETKTEGGHEGKEKESSKPKEKEPAKKEPKESSKDGGKGHAGKKKQSVPITKVIVNVAGSGGSRYLMTSFTLVGSNNDFKGLIEENKDQLLDLANTAMASKSISDLEKPGARNQLRAELISLFNNALGNNLVQEIYFTEFAVQ